MLRVFLARHELNRTDTPPLSLSGASAELALTKALCFQTGELAFIKDTTTTDTYHHNHRYARSVWSAARRGQYSQKALCRCVSAEERRASKSECYYSKSSQGEERVHVYHRRGRCPLGWRLHEGTAGRGGGRVVHDGTLRHESGDDAPLRVPVCPGMGPREV